MESIDYVIMKKIASFTVNHDYITPGIYLSRVDGDVVTYDLRTRRPNCGDYMDHLTMHSLEHMFATLIRNSQIADEVIYFGPMGCQTGFYLLTRDSVSQVEVLKVIKTVLQQIGNETQMYGQSRVECGNYQNLSLDAAKQEAAAYLAVLESKDWDFVYPNA